MKWLFLLVLIIPTVSLAKTVRLSWDPSPTPTVTGYIVLVSQHDTMSPITLSLNAGNVLTITINGLEDSDEHWFAVTAYDHLGNNSCNSNIVYSPIVEPEILPPVLPKLDFKIGVDLMK